MIGIYYNTPDFFVRMYPEKDFEGVWFGIDREGQVWWEDKIQGTIKYLEIFSKNWKELETEEENWQLPEKELSDVPSVLVYFYFQNGDFSFRLDGDGFLKVRCPEYSVIRYEKALGQGAVYRDLDYYKKECSYGSVFYHLYLSYQFKTPEKEKYNLLY